MKTLEGDVHVYHVMRCAGIARLPGSLRGPN